MKKTQHARVFILFVSTYSIICNTFIRKENDTRKNIWWSECKHLQRLKRRNYNDLIYFVSIGTCGLHTFTPVRKMTKNLFPQKVNKLLELVYTVIGKSLSLQLDYEKLRLIFVWHVMVWASPKSMSQRSDVLVKNKVLQTSLILSLFSPFIQIFKYV